jgi:isoquinoline 1-oxidoreductase beta subunit
MLTATIKACPVIGGKLKSFEAAKVEKMPGVKKVVAVDGVAVAVVADTYWNARTALAALPVQWDVGKLGEVSSDTIDAMLKEGLDATDTFVGNKAGDAKAAIAGAAKKVEAVYSFPYQHHVTMEPMNATALFTPDKCEVWCGTQNGEAALATASEAAGLPIAKCDVHKQLLGGGFGRRGRSDYVRQAVLIAKEMPGTPVKLIWSREEDMTHCQYHPITMCKLVGGLDAQGNLVGLHMRISGQSILATLLPQNLQNGMDPVVFQGVMASGVEAAYGYQVPNLLVDHAMRNPHITPGFWRGVNTNQNAVYMECFMDELAEAAGKDPLEFRLKMLKPKWAAVLKAAADKAGYGKKLPDGHFHGLAQVMGYGSYVAGVAEVSVSPDGMLKIHKITAATNCGHVVNPAQIERQVAGSFAYGLSAALYGEITVKDGAVEQTNFDSYNLMRIDEMPQVETVLVPTHDFWGGVGEPTIAVAAPAVLNAIAKATGKRVRDLPLMHHELKKGA